MTIADLAFPFIYANAQDDFIGAKISNVDLLTEEVNGIKNFLGNRFGLKDIISEKTYILDLTQAKIEKNKLVFYGEKSNFYRV